MIEIKNLNLDSNRRVIITSDIHANLDLFKKLLDHVNYSDEDYLIINGDLCEKGDNILKLVHYVMKLTENSNRIFVTKGNCDIMHRYVFEGHQGILNYMNNRKKSVLHEMLQEHGKDQSSFQNLEELAEYYSKHYKKMLDWLDSLPVAIRTDDFLIVHAGIKNTIDQTTEEDALSIPMFYEKGHNESQTVIVGHWPAGNYRANEIYSNNPIIDPNKRIISIDGGNQIKKDGQLNALIFEHGEISHTFVDSFHYDSHIKEDYKPSETIVGSITYPNYELKMIKKDKYFTLCENTNLAIQQWVKNEYIYENEGEYFSSDGSTTLLSVSKGERVAIIDQSCDGYTQIKKLNGEIGWIPKLCL